MKNVESKYKALATCTEHLVLVAIFYVPIITLYIIELSLFLVDPNVKMVNLSFSLMHPGLSEPHCVFPGNQRNQEQNTGYDPESQNSNVGRAGVKPKVAEN
uniref:G-protein coupled receptors family 1 profile domain-containing protein n=1 Tax=Anguilla anguilla TaxID=7936 RepID=A0A0E9SH02_ANGAN